jgi:hypothetical protein
MDLLARPRPQPNRKPEEEKRLGIFGIKRDLGDKG